MRSSVTMDSSGLLAREEEFRRLNKQLEKKTVSLMKEIENVMNKKDIFSEFPTTLSLKTPQTQIPKHHCKDSSKCNSPATTPVKTKKKQKAEQNSAPNHNAKEKDRILKLEDEKHNCTFENGIHNGCNMTCVARNETHGLEFLYAFVSLNVQMNVLPQSFLKENVGVESVCKFLASKVKLMQEQIDKLQSTINRKVSQCEGHLTQITDHESERLKLLNKINNLTAEGTETKAKALSLQNRLNVKDCLYREQRNELDKLTAEVKRLRTKQGTAEAKCVTQEEEIERLKQQIEALKNSEKEFRTSTRSLSASHTTAISRLENKVKFLTRTIEKQKELIDNLREQNSLLSMDHALKGCERSFMEFLMKE